MDIQKNQISRKIDITDKKAEYDENVKYLLSEKIILAHILVYAVKEYFGMKPEDVAELIEGMPQVSKVAVNPGESNMPEIIGDNVEDATPNEGKVTYDIRFRALAPERDALMQLIIDVEAQKDYYPGYDLLTRGIYYGARMISAQKGAEFLEDDYDKIKKVYSIWICMNAPSYAENTITEYGIQKRSIAGEFPENKGRYDLMSVIMICLSKKVAQAGDNTKLQRLLGTLLASEMTKAEKKDIIESEYGIPMNQEIERRVNTMCNLSEAIEKRGIEQGIERGIERGEDKMARLIAILSKEQDFTMITKVSTDVELRKKLYKQYGIE
ncbi:MAG: hypothetical protein UHN47_18560 [Lachnospiraceae bacterium]|nr:hypothetical protein [Lachnospiraceae bacterium]